MSQSYGGCRAGLLAALAVAVCAGCGSGGSDDQVEQAMRDLHANLDAGRLAAVCDGLSNRAKRQIGSVGHENSPGICADDLRALVQSSRFTASSAELGPGIRGASRPRLLDVADDGDRATATVTLGTGPYELTFVRQDETWLLDDFFNAVAPPVEPLR